MPFVNGLCRPCAQVASQELARLTNQTQYNQATRSVQVVRLMQQQNSNAVVESASFFYFFLSYVSFYIFLSVKMLYLKFKYIHNFV